MTRRIAAAALLIAALAAAGCGATAPTGTSAKTPASSAAYWTKDAVYARLTVRATRINEIVSSECASLPEARRLNAASRVDVDHRQNDLKPEMIKSTGTNVTIENPNLSAAWNKGDGTINIATMRCRAGLAPR